MKETAGLFQIVAGTAKLKMTVAILGLTLVLIGCASPPHSRNDDTTISVTVRPLDQVHYELTAIIHRRQENHPQNSYGEDRYNFPAIIAVLGGEPVESVNGNESGLGPKARLKVLREAGEIIAEYRVGYADSERSYYTEGRVEVAPK
jgi:hypothetical protein